MTVRLNKFLAECGVGSRRACDALIQAGRVAVNQRVETRLGIKIDASNDCVSVDGQLLRPAGHREYILLHKPKDVVSTVSDERGRRTVLDVVGAKERLYPVGRLDRDTTGLLLLTNDGELAYRLTHPRFQVPKVYEARLNAPLKPGHARAIAAGTTLEEGKTAPCRIEFPQAGRRDRVRMVLHQGWKRQIRRMFARYGYEVLDLKRVAMGPLKLRGLAPGEWRRLTPLELSRLKREVDL